MYMRGTDSTDQSAYTQVMNSGGTDWPAYTQVYIYIYIYIPASVFPDLCSDDTDQPLYTKMYACIMVQTSLHITKSAYTEIHVDKRGRSACIYLEICGKWWYRKTCIYIGMCGLLIQTSRLHLPKFMWAEVVQTSLHIPRYVN